MKITRRQLRQIIKETLDPDLLKGAYVSSREDREAFKDYIAKVKAKRKSIDDDQDFVTVSDDEFAADSQAAYDRMAMGYHSDNPESIDAHVDPHYGYPKTVGYTDPKGEEQAIVVNSLDDMNDILDLLQAQDIPYSVD
tara:strand:+ start:20 stop:433 length:414 start_codon:yes stop_codon:yes gene_type:complete